MNENDIMLCRVADSLFWMSRYIERAENTARLVDVNLQLLLESEHLDDDSIKAHWTPIMEATGDLGLFWKLYNKAESRQVTEFLTFSRENPSSVINCVMAARENARMIRDQISPEMWEIINRLYLYVKDTNAKTIWRNGPYAFYQDIKEFSHLFQGITDATFPHRVGYEFIKCGRYLERADKSSRILDIIHPLFAPDHEPSDGPFELAQWIAILNACSALEAYHKVYVSDVVPLYVAQFILQSRDFPRSVLFSVNHLQLALHAISGCPFSHYSNEAERLTGRIISDLTYTNTDEIIAEGLHEFLLKAQLQIDRIAIELSNRYMFFPIVDPVAEEFREKEFGPAGSQIQSQK